MRQRTVLNIFIGSPGDLEEERKAARDVIERVNHHLARNLGLHIDLRGWEDTLPGFSRPQEKINEDVRSCDLFVGLLWKRWGSQTGEYTSGFEEEFEIACERKRNGELKDIWLFFKQIPQDLLQDPGPQLNKVREFKNQIKVNREIFYKEFNSVEEWEKLFYDYMSDYISKEFGTPKEIPTSSQPTTGLVRISEPPILVKTVSDREEILNVVSNILDSLHEDEKLRVLDNYTKSRIYLLSSALLYDSALPNELLDTHEIQFLYTNRKKIRLLPVERKLILRSLVTDKYEVKAGWFWLRDATVPFSQVLEILSYYDPFEDTRIQALRYLSLICQSPDLAKIRLSLGDSSEEVRIMAIQLFEQHGQVDDIPQLKSIFGVESSKVAEAAWTAIFAILSRHKPEEAIEWILSTSKSKRGHYKNYFESTLTVVEKENLEQLLQDEDEYIRLQTFNSIKDTLDEPKLRLFTDDQLFEIRASAYFEIIARNIKVDTSEIQKKLENTRNTISLADILLTYNPTKENTRKTVLLEVYKKENLRS